MEEKFSRALEKLDKAVSHITFLEWTLMVLTGVRIVTLIFE
jgi:hypothetical protein